MRKKKDSYIKNLSGFIIHKNTSFDIKEAYKTAMTNIIFSTAVSDNKIIAVTSALFSEGKTLTAANLAVTLSQSGSKVLIIDADMRKPSMHTLFNIKSIVGLSAVLGGFCKSDKTIVNKLSPSLDIITAGAVPPNPTELLLSDNMEKLLSSMRQNYDFIIIDTPPINLVSDALLLNPYIAGLLFIVKEAASEHSDIKTALQKINLAGGKILGFIKTGCKFRNSESYQQYGDSKFEYNQPQKIQCNTPEFSCNIAD